MIDSAEKRKSISSIHLYVTAPGVTPNSLKDQEWRQESGFSYSGILATNPPLGQPIVNRFFGIPGHVGFRGQWN